MARLGALAGLGPVLPEIRRAPPIPGTRIPIRRWARQNTGDAVPESIPYRFGRIPGVTCEFQRASKENPPWRSPAGG